MFSTITDHHPAWFCTVWMLGLGTHTTAAEALPQKPEHQK